MAKLHKNIVVAFTRVTRDGGVLCRQSSDAEIAVLGGGYIYFTQSRSMPPRSSRFLIEHGLVRPRGDALLDDCAQSYEAVPQSVFDAFRREFEAAA